MRLLHLLTLQFAELPLVLAAYNAGDAAVTRFHGVPLYRETLDYVAAVTRYCEKYVTTGTLEAGN